MLPVKVLTCLLFVFLFYSNMFLPSVITVVIRLCALFISPMCVFVRLFMYLFVFLYMCFFFKFFL